MNELKAEVVEAVAILELEELKGREKLPNTPLHALAVVSEYGAWLHLCGFWCCQSRNRTLCLSLSPSKQWTQGHGASHAGPGGLDNR